MKKIISIVGARPQFIKHAPLQLQLQKVFQALTLHTGQHYDDNMSAIFFNELNVPAPTYTLHQGGGKPQGEQTAFMITEIEKICLAEKPDAMLVYGDTNSTLAGTLVAAKMHIPLIHIEAGLRSYNRQMPEEVNRIVADEFATFLFCPTDQAILNLKKEGIDHPNIFRCGDVMCDMIKLVEHKLTRPLDEEYYFTTIHRPYNTDVIERMQALLGILNTLDKKVIFSIHPRTTDRLSGFGIRLSEYNNITFIDPVGYTESIAYQKYASYVLTDSGGIQKEAYILGTPCITIRSETEWTETLVGGWNTLVFDELDQIASLLKNAPTEYQPGIYGDGHAAEEITKILHENL